MSSTRPAAQVGDVRHQADLAGGIAARQQDRPSAAAGQPQQAEPLPCLERPQRLVEEQDLGIADQRGRQAGPLLQRRRRRASSAATQRRRRDARPRDRSLHAPRASRRAAGRAGRRPGGAPRPASSRCGCPDRARGTRRGGPSPRASGRVEPAIWISPRSARDSPARTRSSVDAVVVRVGDEQQARAVPGPRASSRSSSRPRRRSVQVTAAGRRTRRRRRAPQRVGGRAGQRRTSCCRPPGRSARRC